MGGLVGLWFDKSIVEEICVDWVPMRVSGAIVPNHRRDLVVLSVTELDILKDQKKSAAANVVFVNPMVPWLG
jgi:hypothetical protein